MQIIYLLIKPVIKSVSGYVESPVPLWDLTGQCIHWPGIGNQQNRLTTPGRTQRQIRSRESSNKTRHRT